MNTSIRTHRGCAGMDDLWFPNLRTDLWFYSIRKRRLSSRCSSSFFTFPAEKEYFFIFVSAYAGFISFFRHSVPRFEDFFHCAPFNPFRRVRVRKPCPGRMRPQARGKTARAGRGGKPKPRPNRPNQVLEVAAYRQACRYWITVMRPCGSAY